MRIIDSLRSGKLEEDTREFILLKPVFVLACLAIITLAFPQFARAADDETLFIPSVGVGRSSLSFARTGSVLPDATDVANYFVLNVGGTVLLNRFYINAKVDIPFSNDSYYSGGEITTVSREDYNFTLGYTVANWLSTYAGYSIGKTNTHGTNPNDFAIVVDHNDSGPFIGISLAKTFRGKGALSFNLAYASLSGSIRTQTADTNPPYVITGNRTISGPTTGFSYGVQWTFNGKGNASYFAKMAVRNYSFKPTTADIGPSPVGVEVRKDLYMLSAGAVF